MPVSGTLLLRGKNRCSTDSGRPTYESRYRLETALAAFYCGVFQRVVYWPSNSG